MFHLSFALLLTFLSLILYFSNLNCFFFHLLSTAHFPYSSVLLVFTSSVPSLLFLVVLFNLISFYVCCHFLFHFIFYHFLVFIFCLTFLPAFSFHHFISPLFSYLFFYYFTYWILSYSFSFLTPSVITRLLVSSEGAGEAFSISFLPFLSFHFHFLASSSLHFPSSCLHLLLSPPLAHLLAPHPRHLPPPSPSVVLVPLHRLLPASRSRTHQNQPRINSLHTLLMSEGATGSPNPQPLTPSPWCAGASAVAAACLLDWIFLQRHEEYGDVLLFFIKDPLVPSSTSRHGGKGVPLRSLTRWCRPEQNQGLAKLPDVLENRRNVQLWNIHEGPFSTLKAISVKGNGFKTGKNGGSSFLESLCCSTSGAHLKKILNIFILFYWIRLFKKLNFVPQSLNASILRIPTSFSI